MQQETSQGRNLALPTFQLFASGLQLLEAAGVVEGFEDVLQGDDSFQAAVVAAAYHRQQAGGLAQAFQRQLQRLVGMNVGLWPRSLVLLFGG